MIQVVIAVIVPFCYPPLGAKYVGKEVTASWIAVIIIFIMSGLSLKSKEIQKAFYAWKFNLVL